MKLTIPFAYWQGDESIQIFGMRHAPYQQKNS